MQGFAIPPMLMTLALAAAVSAQVTATTIAPPERAASAPASPHAMPGQMPPAQKQSAAPAAPVKLVDINRAGRKELMTLPGIGADEATRIIANRPYMTKTELVTKGVLPVGPFLSLKKQVVVMHRTKPASTMPASTKAAEPAKAALVASGAKTP